MPVDPDQLKAQIDRMTLDMHANSGMNMDGSSSLTAALENRSIGGSTGQQRWTSGGVSPVMIGKRMHVSADSPLASVGFAAYDATHRTFQNLFHRQAPTADAVPRPDWNVFATLQNWPMKAAAGLRTTIFGGPQSPKVTGKP